jgi:Condensation domain
MRAATSDVGDSYDLSPMQQGMLYDSLESTDSGLYVIQVSYALRGPLQPTAFAGAWQSMVDRHAALRTSFQWKDVEMPYQVVHRQLELPFEHHDWSSLPRLEQDANLARLVEGGARRGFELDRPPLIRLSLVRTGPDAFVLVLAHHHILLDGWCKSLLFDEVFTFYHAALRGERPVLPEPCPYRAYIDWLREQDLSGAERFWRRELDGFSDPTNVLPQVPPGKTESRDYGEVAVELDLASTERLRVYARRERLTLNTVVLGAWALVLASASDQEDVVFGATVNGRPVELNGAGSIIGLFINTLPVRVRVSRSTPMSAWLSKLQVRQARSRDFDFTPLSQIQRWSAVPGGRRIFESIVVFENNPGFGCEHERYGDIEVGDVKAVIRNSLPLTLRSVPSPKLRFQLLYDGRRFRRSAIECVGRQVVELLSRLPDGGDALVGDKLDETRRVADDHRSATAAAFENAVVDRLRNVRRARRC